MIPDISCFELGNESYLNGQKGSYGQISQKLNNYKFSNDQVKDNGNYQDSFDPRYNQTPKLEKTEKKYNYYPQNDKIL